MDKCKKYGRKKEEETITMTEEKDGNVKEEVKQTDSEVNKEVETEAQKQPEIPPETPQNQGVDPDIAAIRDELNELKRNSGLDKEKARKFDEVNRAISGGDVKEFDKEKFFRDLAERPEETLDNFISEKMKPLHEKARERELTEADNRAFVNLRTKFPKEFNNIIKDSAKYLTKEDIEATNDLPDRTEIRFGLVKMRRDAQLGISSDSKKEEEVNELNEAKKISNRNSITETPSGGAGVKDEGNELQQELGKAKKNFDDEKVADILKEDLWKLSGQG